MLVWGLLSQQGRGQRTQGVDDALDAAGMTVDYLEIDAATNSDPTAGIPTFTAFVASHPDLKVVITDHGNLTASLPSLLQAAGKQPGEIGAGGFDLSGATIQGIKDGWIGFVNDQQEWLQGYLPVLQICLTKVYGFSGLSIDTGAGFVTADNVDALSALANRANPLSLVSFVGRGVASPRTYPQVPETPISVTMKTTRRIVCPGRCVTLITQGCLL